MAVTADRRFEVSRCEPGIVHADPDLISQVVRILTRNAIEHAVPGGPASAWPSRGP